MKYLTPFTPLNEVFNYKELKNSLIQYFRLFGIYYFTYGEAIWLKTNDKRNNEKSRVLIQEVITQTNSIGHPTEYCISIEFELVHDSVNILLQCFNNKEYIESISGSTWTQIRIFKDRVNEFTKDLEQLKTSEDLEIFIARNKFGI